MTMIKENHSAIEKVVNNFDIGQLFLDLYFRFDYSSKHKHFLVEFCDFCNQKYFKILCFLARFINIYRKNFEIISISAKLLPF